MTDVDGVGPFGVRQEWPGRHFNIAVKIAVNEYTLGIMHNVKANTTWREVC